MRIFLSILAGFVTTAVLSTAVDHIFHVTEVYPPYGAPMRDTGLLLLAFSYRCVLTVLGAYITALIAKDRAFKATLILGIVGSLLWLAGAIAMWEFAEPWYNIVGVLTGVPLSMTGWRIYTLQAMRTSQPTGA
jgi:hypothetical protein